MRLSADQLKAFDEQGYVFFPNCFSEDEIALLRAEAANVLKHDRQEVWREKTGAPRTAFAAHTFSEVFSLLARHPRLVEPLRQLFGEDVYVHQFKLNAKAAFEGDVWQWHQDYGTWARDDGMPEPRAMNIAVFLDEVMPINGPLFLIPKSHRQGVLAAGHDKLTTSYPLWTLDKETVTRLVADAADDADVGIVAPTGKPGSVLMFHGNLVHASPPNITPYPRKIVYLTLCAVSNHITKFTRPEWIAHRDFTPIKPVDDDALSNTRARTGSRRNRISVIFALRKVKHCSLHCSECNLIFSLRHSALRPCNCRTLFVLSPSSAFGGASIRRPSISRENSTSDVHALFDAAFRQQLQGPPCAGPARHSLQAGRGRHPPRRKPHAGIPGQESERTGAAARSRARPLTSPSRTPFSGTSPAAPRWRRKIASNAPKRCNGCSSSSTAWSRISAPPISGWR